MGDRATIAPLLPGLTGNIKKCEAARNLMAFCE